jgi:cell division protease FtsH
LARHKDYSEKTSQEIDDEVKRIIDEAFQRAQEIIETHRDKLEAIANALLEYESLDGTQVEDIVRTGHFTPPPPAAQGPPPMGAPAGTPLPEMIKPSSPKVDPGLGSPAPAPA